MDLREKTGQEKKSRVSPCGVKLKKNPTGGMDVCVVFVV
jgi:hypothetical protein